MQVAQWGAIKPDMGPEILGSIDEHVGSIVLCIIKVCCEVHVSISLGPGEYFKCIWHEIELLLVDEETHTIVQQQFRVIYQILDKSSRDHVFVVT